MRVFRVNGSFPVNSQPGARRLLTGEFNDAVALIRKVYGDSGHGLPDAFTAGFSRFTSEPAGEKTKVNPSVNNGSRAIELFIFQNPDIGTIFFGSSFSFYQRTISPASLSQRTYPRSPFSASNVPPLSSFQNSNNRAMKTTKIFCELYKNVKKHE